MHQFAQIAEIFPEDAGTYTCEAFNDGGESFSTCTINVHVPGDTLPSPQFRVYPASATLSVSENAQFTCEADEELLQLHWLKDGRPIDEQSSTQASTSTSGSGSASPVSGGPSRFQFTRDGKQYRLAIAGVRLDDVGQYQAKAIGQKGEQLAAFSLNVTTN